MGNEKSQITVTLEAVEGTGELLKTQYIFHEKTKRSYPKDKPSDDMGYFTHTETHWQTETSFLEYLDRVVLPKKEEIIHRLGLPVNQKMILKLDVHYSHKTPAVLERMSLLNILPLFVPAGCTDIIQECDTVMNKPFKNAMRSEFRDHLHRSFHEFCQNNPDRRPSEWAPKLKMSDLKPLMVSFVEAGLRALQTPEMKQTIITAFAEDGRFAKIRGVEMQLQAVTEMMTELDAINLPVGEEADREDDEAALHVGIGDDDSDDADEDSD